MWSPDGTKIAFASNRNDPDRPECESSFACDFEIYMMNADGSSEDRRTETLDDNDKLPDWGVRPPT